ncbi:AI-2E family transporter [Paracoccus sp. EF6]|uniref:AI-2E family transporter n=2 Tax=Paracoccus benzoatiresistens TaxID=2997341 RepID=A0ABT4JBP7_9RHOB|nr:AI-2E family transporter [Paracoccus sp. EF6]
MAPRRRALSLGILGALLILLLAFAPDVLLVIFAGLLFAVFFSGGGEWLARRLGIGRNWGIGLFLLILVLALAGISLGFAPFAVDQFEQLSQKVPEAFQSVRERLEQYSWGEKLLERATPGALMSEGSGGAAAGAVTATFGALGNFVIMLFIGLYVALDPKTYRKGLLALLAPSVHAEGEDVLSKASDTLANWLVAQMMAMAVVGILTWLGLWLVGVPLAPALGLIAALLAFIPNIGPIIAAVPAVLLGLSEGQTTALLVVGVYVGVQALESYVITPLIQQERVSLPPALIISSQLLMGILFGILGLALATPLAALGLTLVRETYVRRYLEKEEAELRVQQPAHR